MNWVHIALTLAGGGALVVWVSALDRFVQRMHSHHRELWISHGSPPGWCRVPEGSSWFGGSLARQRLLSAMAFSLPAWVVADPVLKRQWVKLTAAHLFLCAVILWMVLNSLAVGA